MRRGGKDERLGNIRADGDVADVRGQREHGGLAGDDGRVGNSERRQVGGGNEAGAIKRADPAGDIGDGGKRGGESRGSPIKIRAFGQIGRGRAASIEGLSARR